ncbi:MAG: hypothetical protein ACK4UN_19790 [Limisphaerales bacterium]
MDSYEIFSKAFSDGLRGGNWKKDRFKNEKSSLSKPLSLQRSMGRREFLKIFALMREVIDLA